MFLFGLLTPYICAFSESKLPVVSSNSCTRYGTCEENVKIWFKSELKNFCVIEMYQFWSEIVHHLLIKKTIYYTIICQNIYNDIVM